VAGLSIVSRWGGRAAESLFALLFPSDGRICGTPLVMISRLPVRDECLASMHPIAGCVCSVCGERILSPYAVSGMERDTCPQTGLTSHQRRENMRGAFTVRRLEEVKRRPLLVVDHVYTTGTNVSECARVLHRAQHLKHGSPQWHGRSRYRHAKWKSCDVRKAMTRLSRWRKRPEAKQRGVGRAFVSRDAVRLP
jgi:hypothetical protein